MTLTLIQAGGFAGIKKTATMSIQAPSDDLLKEIREAKNNQISPNLKMRDVEQYFLKVDDGAPFKIDSNQMKGLLGGHILQLKNKLGY